MLPEAKRMLLEVARSSVAAAAGGSAASLPAERPSELDAAGAAFVSLHTSEGAVRGCVGTTLCTKPLIEVVNDMARAAALSDPRFDPVRTHEVEELEIEISVLTSPEKIESLDEVEIGRDGLVVEGRGRRGLLLPQVASSRGWPTTTFAEHTCQKAGLDSAAYLDDDVAVFRFSALVFSEKTEL